MKKLWGRIKEAWFGALPFVILLGIPTVIALGVGLISIWDDIPTILNNLNGISKGPLIYDIILCVFAVIGAFNCIIGFYLTIDKLVKKIDNEGLSPCWFYIYIIVGSLGIYALISILK